MLSCENAGLVPPSPQTGLHSPGQAALMATFSAVAKTDNPCCLGGELCLLISLYFKVLQQLGSFTIELRKFSFHLLPNHIKMKETMLTGAKRKNGGDWGIKKKKLPNLTSR